MKRAILLQTVATNRKNNRLKEFIDKAINEYNRLLSERNGCNTFMEFHHKTFLSSKKNTSFNVQIICSLIRSAWKKKTNKVNGLTGELLPAFARRLLGDRVKSLLERNSHILNPKDISIQISNRRVDVTQLLRPNAVDDLCSVNYNHQPMESSGLKSE